MKKDEHEFGDSQSMIEERDLARSSIDLARIQIDEVVGSEATVEKDLILFDYHLIEPSNLHASCR